MSQLQSLVSKQYYKLNLLMILGGFLSILAELAFTGHTSGAQSIGLYSTILGAVLTAHSLIDERLHKVLAIMFLLLCLFGIAGTFKHFTARENREMLQETEEVLIDRTNAAAHKQRIAEMASSSWFSRFIDDFSGDTERTTTPPLVAPLAITGLSIFAALSLLAAAQPASSTKAIA